MTGRSLALAVETYLAETKDHKKRKTFSAYRTALTYFLDSCRKDTLEQIDRADLLKFKTYLKVSKKQSDRSQRNKFENVMTFLKQHKITTGLVSVNDWPKYTEEEPECHTARRTRHVLRCLQ